MKDTVFVDDHGFVRVRHRDGTNEILSRCNSSTDPTVRALEASTMKDCINGAIAEAVADARDNEAEECCKLMCRGCRDKVGMHTCEAGPIRSRLQKRRKRHER